MRWTPKEMSRSVLGVTTNGSIFEVDVNAHGLKWMWSEANYQFLCLDVQKGGKNLLIGEKESRIILFDNEIHKMVREYQAGVSTSVAHVNRVFSVKCLQDDKNIFISGGWDSVVNIWDIREKRVNIVIKKACLKFFWALCVRGYN